MASGLFLIVTAAAEVAPVVRVLGGSLSQGTSVSASPGSFFFLSFGESLGGDSVSSPLSSSIAGWVGSYKNIYHEYYSYMDRYTEKRDSIAFVSRHRHERYVSINQ